VFTTIAEAVVLVVLVIFFFLRNLRATLIPFGDDPGVAGRRVRTDVRFGFTINTLTLLAMVLAIAWWWRCHRRAGEHLPQHRVWHGPCQRCGQGHQGNRLAVVAMTLTLTAVYAPLAFATGPLVGSSSSSLWRWPARAVSGFVALTLSPMMCSKLLKHEPKHGKVFTLIEGWLDSSRELRALAFLVLDRR